MLNRRSFLGILGLAPLAAKVPDFKIEGTMTGRFRAPENPCSEVERPSSIHFPPSEPDLWETFPLVRVGQHQHPVCGKLYTGKAEKYLDLGKMIKVRLLDIRLRASIFNGEETFHYFTNQAAITDARRIAEQRFNPNGPHAQVGLEFLAYTRRLGRCRIFLGNKSARHFNQDFMLKYGFELCPGWFKLVANEITTARFNWYVLGLFA